MKNTLIKSRKVLLAKKTRTTDFLLTPKSKLPAVSIISDGYSKSICGTENDLWFYKPHRNSITYSNVPGDRIFCKDNTPFYFNRYYRFLVDWDLINYVFFRCFDIMTGSILYSAGSGSFVTTAYMNSELGFVAMRLPSGYLKKFPLLSVGVVGRSAGIFQNFVFVGKYKFTHKKKSVRGIAMNPVDHPNGGRSNVKRPFMNLYNKIAKKGK